MENASDHKNQPESHGDDSNDSYGSDSESQSSSLSDSDVDKKVLTRRHQLSKVKFPLSSKRWIYDPMPDNFKAGVAPYLKTLTREYSWSKREYSYIKKDFIDSIIPFHMTKAGKNTFIVTKIQKIVNGFLWRNYQTEVAYFKTENKELNERFLWHGTPYVDDLIKNGFNVSYADYNGMYGAGLYFAKHSSKADQYVFGIKKKNMCETHSKRFCTDCERRMLLCRILMGRSKNVEKSERHQHAPEGFDSVVAVPRPDPNKYVKYTVAYPEYIVYKGEQVYPQYLVTYKLQ